MRETFEAIYRDRGWGDVESVSGPGSSRAGVADFLGELLALIDELGVRTLVDAPCGDFNWADALAEHVDHYIGVDIVPELVSRLQRQASGPGREFRCLDLTSDPLPAGDLVLCRDCLVHFSEFDVWRAFANLRQSGARWLLTTTFVGDRVNEDVVTGDWRPLNLERPPFRLPPAHRYIDERCLHTGGIWADKSLGLWEIDALPTVARP